MINFIPSTALFVLPAFSLKSKGTSPRIRRNLEETVLKSIILSRDFYRENKTYKLKRSVAVTPVRLIHFFQTPTAQGVGSFGWRFSLLQ